MPTKKITQGMVLDAFIEQMLVDGQIKVELDEQHTLRERLRRELEGQIEDAMLGALSDAKLVELSKMLDKNEELSEDDFEKFFKEAGVDSAKVVEQTMRAFREAYLSNHTGGQA